MLVKVQLQSFTMIMSSINGVARHTTLQKKDITYPACDCGEKNQSKFQVF